MPVHYKKNHNKLKDTMTIELYYSNQLSILFECLNINLQSSYKYFSDPFQPDKIIVLNTHTRKWLQLNLAAKNGVVANIEFPFLEGVLWDLLKQLDPNPIQADFLNKEKLRIVLYELFLTQTLADLEVNNSAIAILGEDTLKYIA